ncbi:MAG: rhomboid family intramembrane serine protease [Chromatiales bacterium]|jgi:membrane associated rhomboid family serine protease
MLPLHDDNPTRSPAVVTYTLIAACVLVFLWQISLGTEAHNRVVYALGSIPAVLFGNRELDPSLVMVPAWATVVTSMFLHGGWMHLLGNMLFLWIFGNNVEDVMSHGRFIVFYLLCGVAAAMAQAVPDPESVLPMIGASGAISGVLGAYLLLFPHARVLVGIPLGFLIYTVYMPAAWVLLLWFGLQLLNSWLAGDQEGGVAFGAHIGGFAAGMLLIPLFKRRSVRLFAPPRRR